MTRGGRIATVLVVLVAGTVVDQLAKLAAMRYLAPRPPIVLLAGLIRLAYAENQGAFLSLGAGLSPAARFWLLAIAVGLILAVALAYTLAAPRLGLAQVVALSLIVSGGLGNLLDRMFRDGSVVDFVVVGVGPLHTGVFNVADLLLVAGIILFALAGWRARPAG